MDLSVEDFIDGLFKEGTVDIPSDVQKTDVDTVSLPPWYDKDKFERGRKFLWKNLFSIGCATYFGLIAVFAVPSILNVLKVTYRSNSTYTAYARYVATFLLILGWFEHELKPGSESWKTLHLVRSRHYKSSFTTKKKGVGIVSQRDLSLTLFGLFGFAFMNPEKTGTRAFCPGDWDAFVHCWAVIGYMLGIEDRYNLCRKNIDETREVFKIIRDRVYTPCLENVPEHFEHMTRVMLDGMIWSVPISDESCIYYCKYFANVPGYIMTEAERIEFKNRLKEKLKGKPIDTGVDSKTLVYPSAVEGLPKNTPPRYFYVKDYDTLSDVPAYKRLGLYTKFRINLNFFLFHLANYAIPRFFLNLLFKVVLLQMKYFPWVATFKFGKKAFVDMTAESPMDNTDPQPNTVYYKNSLYV